MSTNQSQSPDSKRALDLVFFATLLYKWRKFLIIQAVVISIVSVIIALIIPKTYSSSATILPPGQSSSLAAFLPQNMTQGLSGVLGSSAFDQGGETNKIMAILYSRNIAEKTIRKFGLMERYDVETIEDALEIFKEKINIQIDEEATIRVTTNFKTDFFHPSENEQEVRQLTTDICTYIVDELDHIYTALGTQKARYELEEIERRYAKNKEDLNKLELELKRFSEKHGIISLSDQTEGLIKVLAQLESQIVIEDVKLSIAKRSFSANSKEVQSKEALVSELTNKLQKMKFNNSITDSLSTFPSFEEIPELGLKYVRIKRELTVQNLIYEFLTQQVERLRMQETKDTPSIQFVDLPKIPTKRSAPTRSLLVIGLVFGGMVLCVSYIILYTYYYDRMKNLIEKVRSSSNEH